MPPKLTIQPPPFYPLELDLTTPSPPRIPLPRPSTYTRQSELQKKLNAIVKRVIGESTPAPSFPDSSSELDSDDCSEYGEDAPPPPPPHHRISTHESSISNPSSYTSLASLNPYSIAPEDVGEHLALFPPPPSSGQGDKHAQDEAWLARQLDRAHAAVVAEEDAALQALRQQTRLC
ncbi:hypothetical protein GGR58DRAFT_522878 [Xylaria digitata]|nr:hypothetical protein GGR58DRAFT_522878 [Xylaria digitata]